MAQTIYLSLGSNVGDRRHNLTAALAALGQEMTLEAVSSVYETDPVGVTDQPLFLNIVVEATCPLAPERLLEFVKRVEIMVGRQPTFRWGPRVVDIDILLYGDVVIHEERLDVPHPRLAERAFVLVPLAEIAPTACHPISGQTVQGLLQRVEGLETVRVSQPPNLCCCHGSPSM
ncbi:MAG: 2-amino-4-hydroxy-6-hydroxymethyldihydropteridine diphosphokinase [Chloroflexota bacterium]